MEEQLIFFLLKKDRYFKNTVTTILYKSEKTFSFPFVLFLLLSTYKVVGFNSIVYYSPDSFFFFNYVV